MLNSIQRLRTMWVRNKKYKKESFTDKELAIDKQEAAETRVNKRYRKVNNS